ncbi:MAG: MerR family transcriptional regulator, partial [Lachnospiraceae bacterium]|nr:MerR family transcriptional regulator [Lachnospiraceae bacterium]
MSEYLSIGKVSKLKNVSIKSLRYYDELGIFRPAYINPKTNYRYYTRQQLPLLDAISLCIEIGIPLRDFDNYKDAKGNVDLH